MTDDGSYGEQGLVTKKLDELIEAGRKIDFVLAVGPVPMMRAVARMTTPLGIKTMVSLNSIMVDGTGMCGGCRASRRCCPNRGPPTLLGAGTRCAWAWAASARAATRPRPSRSERSRAPEDPQTPRRLHGTGASAFASPALPLDSRDVYRPAVYGVMDSVGRWLRGALLSPARLIAERLNRGRSKRFRGTFLSRQAANLQRAGGAGRSPEAGAEVGEERAAIRRKVADGTKTIAGAEGIDGHGLFSRQSRSTTFSTARQARSWSL